MKGKVISISELNPPNILYKFRCYNEQNASTLLEKKIFIPQIKFFNDPYDANLPFRYNPKELTPENIYKKCLELSRFKCPNGDETFIQKEAYKLQETDPLNDDQHLERFDKLQFERLNSTFGVMCLTSNVHNFLMWSYYSNSHTGFCIGYNSQKLIESGLFGMGGEVLYSKKIPTYPLFTEHRSISFLNLLFTKSMVWKHEDEFRLIHTFKDGFVQKIDIDFVDEIILGCKFDDKEALDFTTRVLNIFPHVTISKMRLKKEGFGLLKETLIDEKLRICFGPQ